MDSSYNAIDLIFFLGFFAAVLVVGFFSGRNQSKSVGAYFRAGNRLPWYAIGFSIIASGISSEQFVGEMGYAYKLGMPVVNWEWLCIIAISILLWIYVPIYMRNRITTMPEYLEQRFGGQTRTVYAWLTVASYVFVNFALVFYTGGYALEMMWGIDKLTAVWALAAVTGLYTVYGGLKAVAWTSSLQCLLLLGGGLYIFFAGMNEIHWNFQAILGSGQQAHLATTADHPEIPWTALVILALSTNLWYYTTNQYINQRCLAARNEWHAKMGVLLAGMLQIALPLATCFPGMIYRVINPNLADTNAAYPEVVAAVVPIGLRGLVAAAVIGAIMSTISGLVNSTSTIMTLDIFRRHWGRDWSEERLVRFGRWSGSIALLIGALFAPVVMKWESLFRYAQDIWAPMAAPVVVVFLTAAFWKNASPRGALACLWLAILTVPFSLAKALLADKGIEFLPTNLANSLVFAGSISLVSWCLMVALIDRRNLWLGLAYAFTASSLIFWLAAVSPVAMTLLMCAAMAIFVIVPATTRSDAIRGMWDFSMLVSGHEGRWYANLWIWWTLCAAIFVGIYIYFW
ncbi:MAG: sodium/solute symporter [Pirellulales bacterium]|nr:sodium/solute symporter [Pirellulales bacterium]